MPSTQVKQDLGFVSPSLVTPNNVDLNNLTNDDLADGTWKTVEARHFILNFLIVILWSAAVRPINREYESWFLSRARFADRLLKRLSFVRSSSSQ